MKRLLQFTALAGIVLSLNSCGLPVAAARSVGSALQSVGGLAAAASAL